MQKVVAAQEALKKPVNGAESGSGKSDRALVVDGKAEDHANGSGKATDDTSDFFSNPEKQKEVASKMIRYIDLNNENFYGMNKYLSDSRYKKVVSTDLDSVLFAIYLDELKNPEYVLVFTGVVRRLGPFRYIKDEDFYGIKSAFAQQFAIKDLPKIINEIRKLLIDNKQISLDLFGASSGSACASIAALMLEYLIAYHRLNLQSAKSNNLQARDAKKFAEGYYDELVGSGVWKNGALFGLVKKKLLEKNISNPKDTDIKQLIIEMDRDTFNSIAIKGIYLNALNTIFDSRTADKYNNFCLSSIDSSLSSKSLYLKTYNFKLRCDICSDVLDSRTVAGKIVKVIGGSDRKPHGQLFQTGGLMVPKFANQHFGFHYRNDVYRFILNESSIVPQSKTSYLQYFSPLISRFDDINILQTGPLILLYFVLLILVSIPLILAFLSLRWLSKRRDVIYVRVSDRLRHYFSRIVR